MKRLFTQPLLGTETSELAAQEFHALYEAHHRMVRGVLFNLAGSGPLDDLTQETFLRVWQSHKGFRGDSSLKTWIYRLAVNAAIDHLRKRKRWKTAPLKDSMPDRFDGEQSSIEKDLVQRGLLTLSEDHRVTLVLSSLEGLSVAEVADILEVPEGTVRSRLHHAKQNLFEYLQKQGVKL